MSASSTDPPDKFYGIMSLLKPETRAMIQVDYNLDYTRIIQDVRTQVCTHCAKHAKKVTMINLND